MQDQQSGTVRFDLRPQDAPHMRAAFINDLDDAADELHTATERVLDSEAPGKGWQERMERVKEARANLRLREALFAQIGWVGSPSHVYVPIGAAEEMAESMVKTGTTMIEANEAPPEGTTRKEYQGYWQQSIDAGLTLQEQLRTPTPGLYAGSKTCHGCGSTAGPINEEHGHCLDCMRDTLTADLNLSDAALAAVSAVVEGVIVNGHAAPYDVLEAVEDAVRDALAERSEEGMTLRLVARDELFAAIRRNIEARKARGDRYVDG